MHTRNIRGCKPWKSLSSIGAVGNTIVMSGNTGIRKTPVYHLVILIFNKLSSWHNFMNPPMFSEARKALYGFADSSGVWHPYNNILLQQIGDSETVKTVKRRMQEKLKGKYGDVAITRHLTLCTARDPATSSLSWLTRKTWRQRSSIWKWK